MKGMTASQRRWHHRFAFNGDSGDTVEKLCGLGQVAQVSVRDLPVNHGTIMKLFSLTFLISFPQL